jgi:myo-inositol-1(or 4)-monophosphatase
VDWLAVCRRAAERVRTTLARYPTSAERAVETGRGEGGDTALVIDRAAEDAVLEELDALGVPLTVVSEERGELTLAGGGPVHVVVDPIDGSLNAKRGLPFASVSIAVAGGPALPDVDFGYVAALDPEREWWAERGGGAFADGERLRPLAPGPLEILGLETARPELVAKAAPALASLNARRIRAIGSVAVTLAFVADGSLDAMLSLRSVRSVDAAAGVLLVEEAGGVARYADVAGHPPLGLGMRSRVFAARDQSMLDSLLVEFPLWISSGPDGERGPGWQG